MIWIIIVLCLGIGLVGGYAFCLAGTYLRVHHRESELRALINTLEVERALGAGWFHADWVLSELETMLHREYE